MNALPLPQMFGSHSDSIAARRCLLILPFLVAGCGGNDFSYPCTTLKGVVKIEGRPIEKGSVTFVPLGPGQAVGAAIRNGEYVAKGVPLGTVIVTFNAMLPSGKLIDVYGAPCAELVNVIPAKYQTGVHLEVIAGQEEQTFELTSH